ncbi:MAG: carbohydrate binding domain-containing protein [Oscillospiraceae bacterium]|nr:carbohydrate binding domain-containing protein [Oscillospiraceae bacterium]
MPFNKLRKKKNVASEAEIKKDVFDYKYDPARVLYHNDFEKELNGWEARTILDPDHFDYGKYEVRVEVSDEQKRSGSKCMKISGRRMNWNGATLEITSYLKQNIYDYEVQAWVKFGELNTDCKPQRLTLTLETHATIGGVDFPHFDTMEDYCGNVGILSKYWLPVGSKPEDWDSRYPNNYTTYDGWVLLRGKINIRPAHHTRVLIYFETGEDELNSNVIYVDDFVLLRGIEN